MFKLSHPELPVEITCLVAGDGELHLKSLDVAKILGSKSPYRFAKNKSRFVFRDLLHKSIQLPHRLAKTRVMTPGEAAGHLEGRLDPRVFADLFGPDGDELCPSSGEILVDGRPVDSFREFLSKFKEEALLEYDRQTGEDVETVYWSSGEEAQESSDDEITIVKEEVAEPGFSVPRFLKITTECGRTYTYGLMG